MHRLLLHFNLHLLLELHGVRVVLRLTRHRGIGWVLVDQLLLDLVGARVVLILVVSECKASLTDGWVLHVSLGRHEADRPLLLLLRRNII